MCDGCSKAIKRNIGEVNGVLKYPRAFMNDVVFMYLILCFLDYRSGFSE